MTVLVVMFLFTSVAHFNRLRHDLARMAPICSLHPLPSSTSLAFSKWLAHSASCSRAPVL